MHEENSGNSAKHTDYSEPTVTSRNWHSICLNTHVHIGPLKMLIWLRFFKMPEPFRGGSERWPMIEIADIEALYQTIHSEKKPDYSAYHLLSSTSLPASDLLSIPILSRSDTEFARFIRALGNLDWITQVHTKYHSSEGKRPYCQQTIPDTFEDDLAACYDAEYKADLKKLSSLTVCTVKWKTPDCLIQNITFPALCCVLRWKIRSGLLRISFWKTENDYSRQAKQPTTKVRQGINKLRGTPPRRNLNI